MRNNHTNYFLIAFSLVLFLLTSCDKETTNDENIDPNLNNVITFQVKGFENIASLGKSSPLNDVKQNLASKINLSQNMAIQTSFHELPEEKIQINKLAATALNTDSKYYLLVFEKSTKKFIFGDNVSSNNPVNIPIERGVEYEWIALSNNTTDPFTIQSNDASLTDVANQIQLGKDANNVITIFKYNTGNNLPFMMARGEAMIPKQQTSNSVKQTVNILFKHKTVRFKVAIDASDYGSNSKISTVSIKVPSKIMQRGKFDFFSHENGSYEEHTTIVTQDTSFLVNGDDNTYNVKFPTANQAKVTSDWIYTSNPAALGKVYIDNINLNITYKESYPNETSDRSVTLGSKSGFYNFSISNSLVYGTGYEFKINASPSNIFEVPFDNYKIYWAKFNLAYDPDSSKYYIRKNHDYVNNVKRNTNGTNSGYGYSTVLDANNNAISQIIPNSWLSTSNRTDYFSPGYLHMGSPGSYDANRDLCKEVKDGTWRLPTFEEYRDLFVTQTSTSWTKNSYYNYRFNYKAGNSNNGLTGDILYFYGYGNLTRPKTDSNVWTPQRSTFAYSPNVSADANNNFDAGTGRYLYKITGGGFGYIQFYQGPPTTNNPTFTYGTINEQQAALSAYSIRCIREVGVGLDIEW